MKMTINVTEKCNMSCGYCYDGEKGHAAASLDMVKAAVDFAD